LKQDIDLPQVQQEFRQSISGFWNVILAIANTESTPELEIKNLSVRVRFDD